MPSAERYVWAEVNLAALNNNMSRLKALCAPNVRFCAVVKGDGYGLGAVAVAREALAVGSDYLSVAAYSEAAELRSAGFTVPVLVLGHVMPEQANQVVAKRITQAVYSFDQAQALSRAAVDLGMTAKVHVKIDTGMSRLGVRPEAAAEFCAAVAALPNVEVEGAFTHFSSSDSEDKSVARAQFDRFQETLAAVAGKGVNLSIRHCCNSAATMDMPYAHLDMVRPGTAMYGFTPGGNRMEEREDRWPIPLEPALALKGRLSFVKPLKKGEQVGYGGTFTAPKDMILGTVPIGFADGYPRALSYKASVLVGGRRCPLAGRVCMDQSMVDLSEAPDAKMGDEVTFFGGSLPLDELSTILGSINQEFMTGLHKRVPREYVR